MDYLILLFVAMFPPVIGAMAGAGTAIFIDNKFFKNDFNFTRFSFMYLTLVLIGAIIGAGISHALVVKP